ncbi:MAG: restriction endonuclease [Chloroflexi bacterium]|nr:restriction endonuclease [Chloroflexota bacterium]
MPKSDLPFGSEFSPSQIELAEVLDLAKQHGGDWKAFEAAVRARYFESYPTSDYNRGKLANNCKLGMIAYGIIDREARLTEFGEKLWQLRGNTDGLYAELGRHILLDLHGLALVQTIQDMDARGEAVTLNKLREWLQEQGILFPRGGKHPSIMRLWLEKAGVFIPGKWRINEARLPNLAGASSQEIERLASLTPEQRAYLKALSNTGAAGPYPSNDIERLASATYGVKFDEKNLPKSVLYPLEDAGYIRLTRATTGRGAKPFQVEPTRKLAAQVVKPLIDAIEKQARPELRGLLRKPLTEILAAIDSEDRNQRGLALEALAFHLMRLIYLTYIATRLRGAATGGAEVDLIFEGSRLMFSRWQIQCKHTASVSLDDVAKEVGLLRYFGSDVGMVVSTGGIDPKAFEFAKMARREMRQPLVLIDRDVLWSLTREPTALIDAIRNQAPEALIPTN